MQRFSAYELIMNNTVICIHVYDGTQCTNWDFTFNTFCLSRVDF